MKSDGSLSLWERVGVRATVVEVTRPRNDDGRSPHQALTLTFSQREREPDLKLMTGA
jgi:hypothetical protein